MVHISWTLCECIFFAETCFRVHTIVVILIFLLCISTNQGCHLASMSICSLNFAPLKKIRYRNGVNVFSCICTGFSAWSWKTYWQTVKSILPTGYGSDEMLNWRSFVSVSMLGKEKIPHMGNWVTYCDSFDNFINQTPKLP